MLLVAITLSAMGIFGFMSNAHSQRTQEIIPIEMEIKQKQTEIKILNDAILINNQQLNQFNNKALDKYTEMGYVTKAVNLQKEQQKITDKLCDVMREKTNSDIALWHHSGVRSFFHEGEIDSRDVKEMAPFLDYVVTAQVSEKTLVDAFKKAVDMTFETSAHKPGLIAVSGLNYTVDPEEGELLAMNFIDKEGKEHKIDVENPSEDKMYKVVTDEFLMSAGADYDILAPEEVYVEKFPYDKDVLTCEYIKEMNEPVVINQVGRIKFVHEED